MEVDRHPYRLRLELKRLELRIRTPEGLVEAAAAAAVEVA